MKRLKQGFTLAEVLITLAIIGIVAAITMPNLIINNQYKTVGVKLAKFMATTESATRAYVASNDVFSTKKGDSIDGKDSYVGNDVVSSFINDSYLIKELSGTQDANVIKSVLGDGATAADNPTFYTVTSTAAFPEDTHKFGSDKLIATLKDNTYILATMCAGNTACDYNTSGLGKGVVGGTKTGEPVFVVSFNPGVQGLPAAVHHNYNFVVTELGFVFPAADESCLWQIYNEKFVTNSNTFSDKKACYGDTRKMTKDKE